MQRYWVVLGLGTLLANGACSENFGSCEGDETCESGVGGEGGESGGSGGDGGAAADSTGGTSSGGGGTGGAGATGGNGGTSAIGGSGGSAAVGGSGGTGAAGCQEDETRCGDACVDTEADALHCGDCGNECDTGEVCMAGSCELDCDADLIACEGACIDPETDQRFCGASAECSDDQKGVTCTESEACVEGECLGTNASLADLVASPGSMEPGFASDVEAYVVKVPRLAAGAELTLTPADADAVILVDGEETAAGSAVLIDVPLQGSLSVEVEVTAPSGAMQTYTVGFERNAADATYVKASKATTAFGRLVALGGNHMAVTDGADDVYLYVRSENGWAPDGSVSTFAGIPSAQFGVAMALDGDTLVVADPGERGNARGPYNAGEFGSTTTSGPAGSGGVYVYRRQGSAWAPEAFLKAFNTHASGAFGTGVAIRGDRIAVFAPGDQSPGEGVITPAEAASQNGAAGVSPGAVSTFVRQGSTWVGEAYLKASESINATTFGSKLALSLDTLVAAQASSSYGKLGISHSEIELSQAGSVATVLNVYAFSQGRWAFQAYMKGFGDGAIAVDQGVIAAGVPTNASTARGVIQDPDEIEVESQAFGLPDSGAVHLFKRQGTTWSQQAFIKAPQPGAFNGFGVAVDVEGSLLVVGASIEGSGGTGVALPDAPLGTPAQSYSGAAYVYGTDGSLWSALAVVKATNTGLQDLFGLQVGVSGSAIAVAATGEDGSSFGLNGADNDGRTDSGAVYIYE